MVKGFDVVLAFNVVIMPERVLFMSCLVCIYGAPVFCRIIYPSVLFGNVSKYAEAIEVYGVRWLVLTLTRQTSVALLLSLNAVRR